MKTSITYLCVIACLYYIGTTDSLDAAEISSELSQPVTDSVALDVPPLLVDFTSDGRILAVEGEHQLLLYDQDGSPLQGPWSLNDDEIVLGILGGPPSFLLTNKNIYKLSENKLEQFESLIPPVELSPEDDLEDLPEGVPSEVWQEFYQRLKNFGETDLPMPSDAPRPGDISGYLQDTLGSDFRRVMTAALSPARGDYSKLLAAFNAELITSSPDQAGGVILHSERFRSQNDETLALNKVLHVPKVNNFSLVKPDSNKNDLFVLKDNDKLLHVDRDLVVHRISFPPLFYRTYTDLIISRDPSVQKDKLFLLGTEGVWQKGNDSSWEWKLRTRKGSTTIYGLLPDAEGVLIAGENLYDNASLIHLSHDGKIRPYTTPDFSIGWGNNALIPGEKGKIWIRTNKRVYFSEKGLQEFISVPGSPIHIRSIKEYFSKIWISATEKGFWVIEEGKNLRQLLKGQAVFTSAKFPIEQDGEEHVWIGGQRLLAVLDKELTGKTTDYLEKLDTVLRETPAYVFDLQSIGDFLFAATTAGLVRLHFGGEGLVAQKIVLPGMEEKGLQIMTLLTRENGQIIVASFTTEARRSKLWQGSVENDRFQLINESDFRIHVLAETVTGELLIGGKQNYLYTLRNNKIVPYKKVTEDYISADFKSMIVLKPSDFIILAGRDSPFGLYHVQLDENTNSAIINELNLKTTPWKQSIQLSETQFLLLHNDRTVSLLTLGENPGIRIQKIILRENIYKLAYLTHNERAKDVYLLGEEWIWKYTFEGPRKERSILVATGSRENMDFAVDSGGFWLATENGLRRYEHGMKSWMHFSERDGLPSSNIKAVVSRSNREAIIFTQAGLCKAEKVVAGYWRFISPKNVPGISGTEVHKASLFEIEKRLTLALATDEGFSIVRWVEDNWEKQKWSHFDRNSVLLDNDITSLHWKEEHEELWIGSKEGVVVLPLIVDSGGSVQVQRPVMTLTPEKGLPKGEVVGISVSEDGTNAWILTENVLSRWKRDKGRAYQLAHNEPLFLKDAVEIKLGPSVEGKPPRILVRDKNLNWSVWNPASFVRPRFTINNWFFWYTTQLVVDSLDPALEDPNLWEVKYRIDRLDGNPLKRSWGLALDLWNWRENIESHYMLASVRFKNDPAIEYRATASIPRSPSRAYRLIRLFILFLVISFFSISLTLYFKNRSQKLQIRNNLRLLNREIPYIQGEPIKETSHFFGRHDLLTKMQTTIPMTNYALIGKFRIVKTSIQYQLNNLLKSHKNSKYIFLPIFIDLQFLRSPREKYFFHFLGEHLIELVKKFEVPSEVINQLYHQRMEYEGKYRSIHFKNDIEELLNYFEKKNSERTPVIVFQIDEIGLMNDYDTLLKLRALLNRESRFKVILSGRTLYKDPGLDTVSPWWNIFQEIEIEPLKPSEARELIVDPVKGLFQFDDEAVEHIIARSQGMPLAIQTICTNVLHYKYKSERFTTRITEEDLYASLDFAKEQEKKPTKHTKHTNHTK